MKNVRDAYTYSGTFDAELWYIYLFGRVPCKHEYEVKDGERIDFMKLKVSELQKHFNSTIIFRRYSYEVIDKSEIEKDDEVNFLELDPSYGGSLVFSADNKVVFMGANKLMIYYDQDDDYDKACNLLSVLYEEAPKEQPEEKKSKVGFIKCYNGDYYTDTYKIPEVDLDVSINYNDDFVHVDKDIREFLNNSNSGLVLLYGASGSGKTKYIQHLMTSEPNEYIVIPLSIAAQLDRPDLISFVTDHSDSVFILEDCEQLLEDREENSWNSAISTLLNLSDGIMGAATRIKLICTFNAPITRIDPALLRKGRCIAKYEFGPLVAEKVEKLNEHYNLGLTEFKDMTLAEAFNADSTDYSESKKEVKIGF